MDAADPSLSGLSPQRAFLEKDIMTEQFAELYTYCRVKWLMDNGFASAGERFVIGWDPRDVSGKFTGAAVDGILKAGGDAICVGIMPTPAVSLYMRYIGAAGAFVITASHNPASYNGIKIFTRRGLKLLPGDDLKLSEAVMNTDYTIVKDLPVAGKKTDAHADAAKFFVRFTLDPANSWITSPDKLKSVHMIVDCANGACSDMAKEIFGDIGLGSVHIVNNRPGSDINLRSGVADLEGVHEITPEMAANGGRFGDHEAAAKLFDLGKQKRDEAKNGGAFVLCAVFDGDGDRFFLLVYDPFTGIVFNLSGDETAILQAMRMKKRNGLFVNTVESDLNASVKASELGYETALASVGDKWLLLNAVLSSVKPRMDGAGWKKLEAAAFTEWPSADEIEKILDDNNAEAAEAESITFAIGGEESGHNITCATLRAPSGPVTAFAGNGIKSCLNTIAAIFQSGEIEAMTPAQRYAFLRRPYPSGFKKTLYAFYVDKDRWKRGSPVWAEAERTIGQSLKEAWPAAVAEEMIRLEDPDMLYIKIVVDGTHTASVFVRNSGTEDKTGVSLRCPVELKDTVLAIGEKVIRHIMANMKDLSKTFAAAERELLTAAANGGAPAGPVGGLSPAEYGRLLNETGNRQGLLDSAAPGARPTERGKWYLDQMAGIRN